MHPQKNMHKSISLLTSFRMCTGCFCLPSFGIFVFFAMAQKSAFQIQLNLTDLNNGGNILVHNLDDEVIMDTNGGQKEISQEGDWKGYGRAYFVPDAMMNIVSVSDAVSKGFHVFFIPTM